MKRTESKCVLPVEDKLNLEKKSGLLINVKFEKLIKEHINEEFTVADSKYPLGICGSCCLALLDRERNITRPLQMMLNYEDIALPKQTRSNDHRFRSIH